RSAAEETDRRHRLLPRAQAARRGHRGAQQEHQLAPPHSMTSSAWARMEGGTVRPSALAVLRLITSSNLVGCSTGRSAGLAPLRTLSTYVARWRHVSTMLVKYPIRPPSGM